MFYNRIIIKVLQDNASEKLVVKGRRGSDKNIFKKSSLSAPRYPAGSDADTGYLSGVLNPVLHVY